MFEPLHGSAPDIAGKVLAKPIATICSAALMRSILSRGPRPRSVQRSLGRHAEGPGR